MLPRLASDAYACNAYASDGLLAPTALSVNDTNGGPPQRPSTVLAVAANVAIRGLALGLHDKPADLPLNRHQGAQHGRVHRRPIRILFRELREITTSIQHPIPPRTGAPKRPTANQRQYLNLIRRIQVWQETHKCARFDQNRRYADLPGGLVGGKSSQGARRASPHAPRTRVDRVAQRYFDFDLGLSGRPLPDVPLCPAAEYFATTDRSTCAIALSGRRCQISSMPNNGMPR